MENQIIEQLTAATTKSYETMKNLGDINSSALRKLTDLQFDFISMNVESGIEQVKSLNNKAEAKDIIASSAEFVSDYNEKVIDFTSKTVEILSESRDEATNLFEKVIASEAAPVKKPAKASTAKPAAKKTAKKAA
jgi:phasin family protein